MAQPTPTLITQNSAGSGSSQDTASFTPAVNKLYVATCTIRRNSPAPTSGIVSATHAGGLTMVSEAQTEFSGPNRMHCTFRGLKGSGLSAGVITFSITGGAWDAISWDIVEWDAVSTAGTDGSAAITFGTPNFENGASSPATGTVPTPTSNDTCVESLGTEDDAAVSGPSTGFTNVANVIGTDTITLIDYNTSGTTTISITLGSPRGWAIHPYKINGASFPLPTFFIQNP